MFKIKRAIELNNTVEQRLYYILLNLEQYTMMFLSQIPEN